LSQSILVILLLEWTLHRHSDVVGLVVLQHGQLGAEGVQVQPGHLLVQHLRQLVHAGRVRLLSSVLPELQLGKGLVAERVGHHEGRVTSGATQVEETA
jgi:hypothetical protein